MEGFIHKPEGSNRWEIFFDKIETQLALMSGTGGENAGVNMKEEISSSPGETP